MLVEGLATKQVKKQTNGNGGADISLDNNAVRWTGRTDTNKRVIFSDNDCLGGLLLLRALTKHEV